MMPADEGSYGSEGGWLPSLLLMMKLDCSEKSSLTQLLTSVFSPMPWGLPGAGDLARIRGLLLGAVGGTTQGRSLMTPRKQEEG
jgi:hypothetical protein